MPMTTKRCPDCKKDLPLSAFGLNAQTADGLNYYCKEHARRRQAKWVKKNPAKARAIRKRYLDGLRATNMLKRA